jgi:hypothetical protein
MRNDTTIETQYLFIVRILVARKDPTPLIESVDPELGVNQRFPSYKNLVNCPDS